MSPARPRAYAALEREHDRAWRHPAEALGLGRGLGNVDPRLLRARVRGAWWETLERLGITLLVTREYEHLMVALRCDRGKPATSYLALPHPSGIAVDEAGGRVLVASTRNPNQVFEFRPAQGRLARSDSEAPARADRPLIPVRSTTYPGCLYLHDLALIGSELYGAAAGENAIVRLTDDGGHERVWWPRCVERKGRAVHGRNHIQLNSIAAGATLEDSCFTASGTALGRVGPSDPRYPVDRRGVVLSGRSRETVATGLTRPHSARWNGGQLWVANSGYGELSVVEDGAARTVAKLPGWTRGLCFRDNIVFVGTSRVLRRFTRFAPGLDLRTSRCGIHALDLRTRRVVGSLEWPDGNQIFAIAAVPASLSRGLPFRAGAGSGRRDERELFYAFDAPPRRSRG